jgi:hypothetical protein
MKPVTALCVLESFVVETIQRMTAEEGMAGGVVWLLIPSTQYGHHNGEHEVATENHKN